MGSTLPHSALVRICQWLPPTLRAQAVQHRAAIDSIWQIAVRRRKQDLKEKQEATKRAREARLARKNAQAVPQGDDRDDDDSDEEEEEDDESEHEDIEEGAGEEDEEDANPPSGMAAGVDSLVMALEELDVAHFKGAMDVLHSILILVDTSISAEPHSISSDMSALRNLKRRLSLIKQKVAKYVSAPDLRSSHRPCPSTPPPPAHPRIVPER
jgi:hypothetical protein